MGHLSLKGCLPSPGFIIMPVITFSTKRPWCHYFQCVILKNRTNYIKSDDNSPNFDLPSMFWMRSIKLHCEQETPCHLVFIWFWSLSSIAKLVHFSMKGQETSSGVNVHHHQSPNAAFFVLPADPFQVIIVCYFLHLVMKSKKYALANPVYIADPVFS